MDKLVRDAIARIHEKGSGDYQSLMRQVKERHRKVTLNIPQAMAALSTAIMLFLEWGRGTGKTTFYGYRYSKLLEQMPRSSGLLIGPSYTFLLTRIIPSLVQGLEMFGLYKDLHYFIGRQPPRSWRRGWSYAYQPPERYNNYITFWNGMGCHLISHDLPDDGRGLNTDWQTGDEAAILDPRKLEANTDATLRGTRKDLFKDKSLFGSKMFSSSTPITPEGAWFTDYEEKALAEPGRIAFISATCRHNQANLRDGYLEDARRAAISEWVYLAEYENVRPKFSKDGFYGLLDADVHLYTPAAPGNYDYYENVGHGDCRTDTDLVRGVPLTIGMDWGAAINCLTVNQHLKSLNEFRTIKSMYVLGEDQKIQDDLLRDFDRYYRHHDKKVVYFWYDASGNHRTGNTRQTRAEQAREQLRQLGWEVHLMTSRTMNVLHEDKHLLWETILRGDHPHLPTYRMNKMNCKELYISMKFAKTKIGRQGEVKKDKSSERSGKILRQHATDLSDANDIPLHGMFYHMLRYNQGFLPGIKTLAAN